MALNDSGNSGIMQGSGDNILQNFSDATAGRSLFLYWATAASNAAGTQYVLARDEGVSSVTTTAFNVNSTKTINFDISINKTTSFSGIGYVDLSFTVGGGGTGVIAPKIYHYDGSTETLISDESAPSGGVGTHSFKVRLAITRKAFKPGDILRMKVILTSSGGASGSLKHDPQVAGNELKLWMPVVNLE